ncbi:MAG: hypothetical protein ACRD16_16745 [Thermoanaerobaculia bacterium]
MSMIIAAGAGLAGAVLLGLAPRWFLRRSQDRLARKILARPAGLDPYRLLTRAEKFVGSYRRLPGVLGMNRDSLVFESAFDPPVEIPLEQIRKISSGKLLSTGRRLFRDEVLAITDASGTLSEFQMSHASCFQWRQHLGAWGARQKSAGKLPIGTNDSN